MPTSMTANKRGRVRINYEPTPVSQLSSTIPGTQLTVSWAPNEGPPVLPQASYWTSRGHSLLDRG